MTEPKAAGDNLAAELEALHVEIQRTNKRLREVYERLPEPEENVPPLERLRRHFEAQTAAREAAGERR